MNVKKANKEDIIINKILKNKKKQRIYLFSCFIISKLFTFTRSEPLFKAWKYNSKFHG